MKQGAGCWRRLHRVAHSDRVGEALLRAGCDGQRRAADVRGRSRQQDDRVPQHSRAISRRGDSRYLQVASELTMLVCAGVHDCQRACTRCSQFRYELFCCATLIEYVVRRCWILWHHQVREEGRQRQVGGARCGCCCLDYWRRDNCTERCMLQLGARVPHGCDLG